MLGIPCDSALDKLRRDEGHRAWHQLADYPVKFVGLCNEPLTPDPQLAVGCERCGDLFQRESRGTPAS